MPVCEGGQYDLVCLWIFALKINEVGADFVMIEVMNDRAIGDSNNCKLPGVKVDLLILQEKDVKDLKQFGIPQGMDFVAASFVQSKADVEFIRNTLGLPVRSIKIIPRQLQMQIVR